MSDPSTTGPNLGLPLDIALHADGWDEPYNNAMLLMDTLLGGKVQSVVTATPPGSPSDGDAYIIAASPTGAWSGKAKNLTVYHNAQWNFFAPKKGMRLLNLFDSKFYYYTNSAIWVIEDNTGPAGPEPFDTETAWVTGHAYTATAPASFVSKDGSSYVCLIAHTSGTFATDLGAGKWGLVAEKGDAGATGPSPFTAETNWTTATAYVAGPPASYVALNGSSYVCLTSHTSGTFATDLAAGKWAIVASKGDTGATGATGSGGTGPAPFAAETVWATATSYTATAPASYVSKDGSSYICLVAHTSGTFATDLGAGKWGLVASKGDTGATGSTGATGAANSIYDLSIFIQGLPTATMHLYSVVMARGVTMPADLSGSYGFTGTNPTSTAAIDIKKNGTTCATASISSSGTFTFTTTSHGTVSFSAGDRMDIYAPGTPDATMADIALTLALTRP